MAPDGTFRNDVLPYPMTIIQSPAVDQGQAVIGLGYKYSQPSAPPGTAGSSTATTTTSWRMSGCT